jgi:hypothetical protein
MAHGFRFNLVDDQISVLAVVSEGWIAAHPHAFLLGGGDLVADALAGDLALELREETKETPYLSNTSTIFAKSDKARVSRSTL